MKAAELKRKTPMKSVGKRRPKCKSCGELFDRERAGQKVCSAACVLALAKQAEMERRVAPYRPKRGKLTAIIHDKARATRLCQHAFNALVRYQDRDRPCITCGTVKAGQWHCGHWKTVGAHPELRFRRENANRQCSVCNDHNGGRPAEHRAAIIVRRGQAVVDWLDGPHDMPNWTVDELDCMASAMRAQLRWEKRNR